MTEAKVILSTCSNQEEAGRIAHFLVESRLAACVSLLPGVRSIYRWQGKVESSEEILLVIKTENAQVERIQEAIVSLHSYEIPEFLVMEVSAGNENYLAWLAGSLK